MVKKDSFIKGQEEKENLSLIMNSIENLPKEIADYVKELFRNAPLFVFKNMRRKVFPKGTVFIREKMPATLVYFLVRGRVEAMEHRVLGTKYNFTHYNAFESFGPLESFLDCDLYKTSLETEEECEFLVMSRKDYENWTKNDSHALKMIAKETCYYLLDEARKSRLLRFLSGKDELLVLMMLEYEERKNENGVCKFKLTRQQLSEYSGLSVRTVNRAVLSLEEEGFLKHKRGNFNIDVQQYRKIKSYINNFIEEN